MKTIAAVRDGREDDGRMHSTSGRYVGLLYLAPALAFVVAFTALPVVQMLWMSLHNWSLIEPPKWVGFANYLKAYKDSQFWTSLRFTLTYTLYITPILMVGGFLIALLVAQNTNLRRFTRAVVFVPVVIGLGASSLLWYYLFSYDFGMVNRIALDLGIVREAGGLVRRKRRSLALGGDRVDRLEGDRLRDAALRRRDPGDSRRDR